VGIVGAPDANFTASPEVGGAPLTVTFINTSTGAISYSWKFDDPAGSTSSLLTPPPFTYHELGDYTAELTAYNALGCSDAYSKLISAVNPIIEVELNNLVLQHMPGDAWKPTLTIYNYGNIPLNNLALFFDISGSIVREYVGATIPAFGSLDYVVRFELPAHADVKYFCAEADLDDEQSYNNKVCGNIDGAVSAFTPYPNPAIDQIYVEWVLNDAGPVTVTLINSMGTEARKFELPGEEGFNQLSIDTDGLSAGAYVVKISFHGYIQTYTVIVAQ
jgi:hypothetical protein